MWSLKTGGRSAKVNYNRTCILGGLQGWSLNTGDLKDRLRCSSEKRYCQYDHCVKMCGCCVHAMSMAARSLLSASQVVPLSHWVYM